MSDNWDFQTVQGETWGAQGRRPIYAYEMAADAASALLATVAELRNVGASAAKTKLLKLLYLTDVEHYRSNGRLLTGWHWTFHRFGPWAAEYDQVLDSLAAAGTIELRPTGPGDRDAVLIISNDQRRDLQSLDDVNAQMAMARVLERWARVDLPELLDYVYFETEPMKNAERGRELNFGTIERGPYRVYRRPSSDGPPKKLREVKARLNSPSIIGTRAEPSTAYTPPRYDDEVLKVLASVEDD
jgi:hypothetical protein